MAGEQIVAARRNVCEEMQSLIDGLGLDVVTLSLASARQVTDAYARWGKGIHAAALNLGDCFAYASARQLALPLLYKGDDFALTDIEPA